MAVAKRQAEQLTLVRRRAQPKAVYIARLTVTAVFAYLLALQLPGGSSRSVLAPLTALLVVQATLFHTIGSAIRRVRRRPGARPAAGAPRRRGRGPEPPDGRPARPMADGLAEAPDPRRAAEWLDRTRALRGEIERVDDALAQAEESVRLNPRRLRFGDPAAGLRDGVDTLERAATDMRVLARSVADSARIDSDHSPVREADTRARLAAVIAELSAAVRAYGQLLEADPVSAEFSALAAEPITEALEDHLEEAQRQQDQLADLLSTDPAERPEGWQLRGEILAHVDRLRSELEPGRLPDPARAKPPLRALRDRHWSDRHREDGHHERHHDERQHGERHWESPTGPRRQPNQTARRGRARRTASRVSRVRTRRRALPSA